MTTLAHYYALHLLSPYMYIHPWHTNQIHAHHPGGGAERWGEEDHRAGCHAQVEYKCMLYYIYCVIADLLYVCSTRPTYHTHIHPFIHLYT